MVLLIYLAKMPSSLMVPPGLHPGSRVLMLLDGHDETQGADVQRDIIRLITAFAKDAPLTWIIASLSGLHIAIAFNATVATSSRFKSEFMLIYFTKLNFDHPEMENTKWCIIKGNNWCVRPPVN
jgi:hypothetical protein